MPCILKARLSLEQPKSIRPEDRVGRKSDIGHSRVSHAPRRHEEKQSEYPDGQCNQLPPITA
jgi:hypothetical protein